VEVECLPANIPEHIEVDVTELMLGQAIRLRDVATSPTWRAVTDGDVMLVHIVAPRAVAEPAATDAAAAAATPAAAAEPEVIKKGKAEKAEEEK
jgi:large subunit ribosomal protein L25